jgi:hypothetical protein
VIGALLLNASREQTLPGSSPGLATDPPKEGGGCWGGGVEQPQHLLKSKAMTSHRTPKVVTTSFHTLSPLAPEERRGEGTGVRGREQTGISPNG